MLSPRPGHGEQGADSRDKVPTDTAREAGGGRAAGTVNRSQRAGLVRALQEWRDPLGTPRELVETDP